MGCKTLINNLDEIHDHFKKCPNADVTCPRCGDNSILRKDKSKHDCIKSMKIMHNRDIKSMKTKYDRDI